MMCAVDRGRGRRRAAGAMAAAYVATGVVACAHPRPADTAPAAAFDRTQQPTLGPPAMLVLPQVIRRVLPNGLQLAIVERHELPVADFILVARTGTEADAADKAGLSTLAASLLTRGTTTRSATAFAEQQALLGVSVTARSTWDQTTVLLHAPVAQLDSALALFSDAALHPAFATAEVDRAKQLRATQLVELADQAPFVASRAFDAVLFGRDNPYGRSTLGTPASIAAITRQDLEASYTAAFQPRNCVLIAVGDVNPRDVERRARALFGNWSSSPASGPSISAPMAAPARTPSGALTVYLIDKPDAPQSSMRIGSVGVARSTPDFFPLTVLNSALGGAFTSRLNQNLRETHGYTYGAFSDFDMRRDAGPFTTQAEVVSAKTDSSLLEFMHELRAIRDTLPTAELDKTKRYLRLQLPSDLETTADIARQLVTVVVYGLPDDFLNSYQAHVAAVTQADIQRVARRYIDPGNLTILVVGDRKSIEAPLRAAGVGRVELRGLNGEVVQQ
jgi:zinc protease